MAVHPQPGSPLSLGVEADLADAEAVLTVSRAVRGVILRRGRFGARHLVREAVWDIWERPRLPGVLVDSKYPKSYPWSPSASTIYLAANGHRPSGGWGLVIEHLGPRGLVVQDLIDKAVDLDPPGLVDLLKERLQAAIVSREDDRALNAAGVTKSFPDGIDHLTDQWCRYRHAALDVAAFGPLPVS